MTLSQNTGLSPFRGPGLWRQRTLGRQRTNARGSVQLAVHHQPRGARLHMSDPAYPPFLWGTVGCIWCNVEEDLAVLFDLIWPRVPTGVLVL